MDPYNVHRPLISAPNAVNPDPVNARRVMQQLILLGHAEICRRKRGTHPKMQCSTPYCDMLIEVLTHLNTCRNGETCVRPHCFSSRNIIMHYQRCKSRSASCPVCDNLKSRQNASPNTAVVPQDLFEPYCPGF